MEQSHSGENLLTSHLILFQKTPRTQPHPPTPYTELLIIFLLDISASGLLTQIEAETQFPALMSFGGIVPDTRSQGVNKKTKKGEITSHVSF